MCLAQYLMIIVGVVLLGAQLFVVNHLLRMQSVWHPMHYLFFCLRDDARFPTVRGVLRRGMTVEGLKQFIVTQVGC